ncbi:hypothetical protein [uncultured Croceicoccus sp.]|uniref:hypothetical protein n=1 Tax=uncultured Croceicoccus sp. TaxID=1295329 RepID=UPI00262FDA6D|nr:hypothetical protein [uncultured Croceicoccus sp.]|tara:strand:+ start:42524 stop:42727 length:204 start_codon:yes stop_codon:yes gene_type:complete
MTKQWPDQDEHQWEGIKEVDRAISENRRMEYRWKKALADPWERRGLWLLALVVIAFAVFVILQDFVL